MPKTPGEKYELVMECQQSTFSSSSEASDVVLNVHVHYPGLLYTILLFYKVEANRSYITYIHSFLDNLFHIFFKGDIGGISGLKMIWGISIFEHK